jgi:hypothetical protein
MKRSYVKEVHLTRHPWIYALELECGHWIDSYLTYTNRLPATVRCRLCEKEKEVVSAQQK